MKGNADTGGAVGGKGEMRGVEGGRNQRHARERALCEVCAGLIDDHETTISDDAEGIDVGGRDCATTEGLYGVKEEAGEDDGHGGERRGGAGVAWTATVLIFASVDGEIVRGPGGCGEGGGRGAVETVTNPEAVADELVDAGDGAAGVGTVRAE